VLKGDEEEEGVEEPPGVEEAKLNLMRLSEEKLRMLEDCRGERVLIAKILKTPITRFSLKDCESYSVHTRLHWRALECNFSTTTLWCNVASES
jgi:hypothetical protein